MITFSVEDGSFSVSKLILQCNKVYEYIYTVTFDHDVSVLLVAITDSLNHVMVWVNKVIQGPHIIHAFHCL